MSPGTRINPPLGDDTPIRIPSPPISETEQLLNLPMEDSIIGWIDQLPANLKVFVGRVSIPNDDGLAISEAIVEGECIGASDGSLVKEFRKQKGSHGYALGKKE